MTTLIKYILFPLHLTMGICCAVLFMCFILILILRAKRNDLPFLNMMNDDMQMMEEGVWNNRQ